MMRHLKILEYALSSFLRRKFRNLTVLIVFAFTVAALASILFLTRALKQEMTVLFQDAPALIVQKMTAGRHALIPVSYGTLIETIAGVGEVTPRFWGYYYDPLTDSNYTLVGLSSIPMELSLLEGGMPTHEGQCALGRGLSELRMVGMGDSLILVDSTNTGVLFEVTGVFRAESNLLTNDLVVLQKDDLVRFFGLPSEQATDLAVQVFNPEEIPTVARKIRTLLPDTRPISQSEITRSYEAVFNWRSGMMITIFSSALVAFVILAWDKASGISGEERREIGILKAIGWDTADILALKFWEATIISATSFLIGLAAAFVHVFYFRATLLAPVMRGWSVLFPDFQLTPALDPYQVAVLAFLTVAPYLASTIVPAWKTAISDPDAVMRA